MRFKIGFLITILAFSVIIQNSYTNNASAVTLTLTIPSEPLLLDITDTSSDNGFHKSSPSSFSVKTDAAAGYTLSIKSKNSDSDKTKSNDLIDTSNDTTKLSSISSPVNELEFSSNGEVNTWGYLPSKLNGIENTNFLPGPTDQAVVLDETKTSNMDTNNEYSITLGAKTNNTMPSGNYVNRFIIMAVANRPKYIQNYSCDLQDGGIDTLIDIRDDEVYTVAKLKDGKCWMTKNLRIGSNERSIELTPENSDMISNFTLQQGDSSGLSGYDTANIYITPKPDTDNYGGYYTWFAATAGEGTQSKNSGDVEHSICPKGWHLPNSTNILDLISSYGGSNSTGATALQASPANFVLSGRFFSSSTLSGQGSFVNYWTSTAKNDLYANSLYIDGFSSVRLTNYDSDTKYSRFSVRCIARDNIEYNISYNDNDGSGGPGIQSGSTSAGHIKLKDQTPVRDDYIFVGWCDQKTSGSSCPGRTYKPGDWFSLNGDTSSMMLWAVWKQDVSTMQDWNGCTQLSEHEVIKMIDSRDENTYDVSKLKDGRCWMVQNLKISGLTLTSADSDVSSNFILPTSSLSGFNVSNSARVYIDNTYGGFYNWFAATAGTGSSSMSSGNASSSICPKGWGLPISSELASLLTAYGGNNTQEAYNALKLPPTSFNLVGYVTGNSHYWVDQYSAYWSSSALNSGDAYHLRWDTTHVDYNESGSHKNYGYSVRCIKK